MTSVPLGGDDDQTAWDYTIVTLNPPASVTSAAAGSSAGCVGASLKITTNAFGMNYRVTSKSAVVNITGNFNDLANPDDVASQFAAFEELYVTTDAAPIVLTSVWVDAGPLEAAELQPLAADPNFVLRPHLVLSSASGDITLDAIAAPGITATTGGIILTSNIVSNVIHTFLLDFCGDIVLRTTGKGRIGISKVIGGNNIYVHTEKGILVAAGSAVIAGRIVSLTSDSAKIYVSNFLETSGEETIIATHGADISITLLIANRAIVSTDGAGAVTVISTFVGAQTPVVDVFPYFVPYITANYTAPTLSVTTERGGITVYGVGNNPSVAAFASTASLDVRSQIGSLNIQINGGGILANYTAVAPRGMTRIEIDGLISPSSGSLGAGSGSIYLYSAGGDVLMSESAKPY